MRRSPRRWRWVAVVAGLTVPAGVAFAETPFSEPDEPAEQVAAELIAEHGSIQPHGKTRVGVHFEIEKGWHIYAKEPGDAGLPTTVSWSVPAGVSVGPLQYPKPQQFLDPGDIRTFGYSGAVVLHSTLTLPAGKGPTDAVPVKATVKWLACKAICIPGSAKLDLTLPVSPAAQAFSRHAQRFDQLPE